MSKQKSKFEGIEFATNDVEPWIPEVNIGKGFRCNRGEFVTFWKKGRVQREHESYLCRCWILSEDESLAGYITLLADKLSMDEPILLEENIKYETFPAVKIGLLAADRRAKGAGTCLVKWAMKYVALDLTSSVGVRFLTVDALYDADTGYDASGFYERLGFRFIDPDEDLPPSEGFRTMYFDLKPLIDTLAKI